MASGAGSATGSGGGAGASARRLSCHQIAVAIAAPGRKIACGMAGTRPTAPRISATGSHPRGSANWPPIWPDRSRLSATRVTIAAAAIDSSSAGTCATSASPTASVT